MDPIAALAASGLRSRLDALDLLANNLANGATAGYKADRESYGRFISEDASGMLGDDQGIATLPKIDRLWTDFSQGEIVPTGNQYDVALSGPGFFSVDGPNGQLYTRNGSFKLSSTGVLTTTQGYTVRSVGGGIQTRSASPIEISQDGTVRQDGQELGRLEVVNFAKTDSLRKQGGTYFVSSDSTKPQPATGTQVLQRSTESSNVAVAESTVRIVGIMRQFEMLQKAVMMASEMGKESLEQVAKV